MEQIVVVCGYGCHLNPGLCEYLNRVVRYCNENKPECLIFSGGFTQQKTAPGKSEARLMRDYVVPRLQYKPEQIMMDENSYTTADNIGHAGNLMDVMGILGQNTRIVIFCEVLRALKINLLARHHIRRPVRIETMSWDQSQPTTQILMTLYEWAGIRAPFLARMFRKYRIRRSKTI